MSLNGLRWRRSYHHGSRGDINRLSMNNSWLHHGINHQTANQSRGDPVTVVVVAIAMPIVTTCISTC